jgi:lipoprotein NlpI
MFWLTVIGFFQIAVCLSWEPGNSVDRDGAKAADQGAADSKAIDADLETMNAELTASLREQLGAIPAFSDQEPGAVEKYSRRGDLNFFVGEFENAVADYQHMVRLQPDLDRSHWRLGIAMYFAGKPEQAAAQFDKYHSFDNVDRENGIWRYLSHRQAFGKEKAQEQLLRYEKDDRPPFREVYQLFDGSLSGDAVLNSISADLPEVERSSRLFYAHLYIGLNSAADGDLEKALQSLRTATLNSWPKRGGYGPNYMWHVGRLQYFGLKAKQATVPSSPKSN